MITEILNIPRGDKNAALGLSNTLYRDRSSPLNCKNEYQLQDPAIL